MNLYKLVGNYKHVQDMLNDGEISFEMIKDTLESIETAIEVKAQNIVYITKNLQAYSNGIEDEIKRLQTKQCTVDNQLKNMEMYLFSQLEIAGLVELKTPISTIKKYNNRASVNITDSSKIPAKYQTVVPESYVPRKADIAKDLKAGITVPGCELKQSKSWRIK